MCAPFLLDIPDFALVIGGETDALVRVFVEDPMSVLLVPDNEDEEGELMLLDNGFVLLLLPPFGGRGADKGDFEELVPRGGGGEEDDALAEYECFAAAAALCVILACCFKC